MSKKALWILVFGLVIVNCFTIFILIGDKQDVVDVTKPVNLNEKIIQTESEEIIASVGNENIYRQQWLNELEAEYGKATLQIMIDRKVIELLAEKYNIQTDEESVERELKMIKKYSSLANDAWDDEKWREQIRYSMLLEQLLTKDANVQEDEIRDFYEKNKELYNIETKYHLSHIVVKTRAEAKQVNNELKEGSSFDVLAMEKSVDEFTANHGGELGVLSSDSKIVPKEYFETAEQLKQNEWSQPITVEGGFAVVLLHEKIDGINYTFESMKDQIRRQIALEQMDGPISAQPFWDEAEVSWFYGKDANK
ncbi:peptidyl-prolyl cis-trans isomerase [Cytobacillus sp. IB215665]|uniref:peptidyl-prolyl cis-trans isomerase n=1 Tax=Cytobacillus sp. IB215665 TaxID=3097357 RepID=UPI002A145BDF|nr:peptidyl-prolyl cis-trans isomerase [Cytobacillus sp. IB215665]MDX8367648.1 peptidyl-prolyl cis-trans isomerase [Cytobacillus sp. IB215665]